MTGLFTAARRLSKHPQFPILLLLTANIIVGLFTFRDYGLSWDEPLFYNYADSIRGAYTPQAFAPGFNFEQVYGRSAEDHKFYGPAYLLFAWPLQRGAMWLLQADMASAWHLVNFLTFQFGLWAFYRLIRRWLAPWPATVSTAFFGWQPVFWGQAFINPKDIPFMAFFLLALTLGLEAVDASETGEKHQGRWVWAALALGAASAIRVIGPLAGVLIAIYFVSKKQFKYWPWMTAYTVGAMLVMFTLWPYLWAAPLPRLLEVLKHMSNNPTELAVLFLGQVFHANEMPRRYLPQLFALTFTLPAWPLFATGVFLTTRSIFQKKQSWHAPLLILALFAGMMGYLIAKMPSMYDGYRHFLFILPPVFIFSGIGLDWLLKKLAPALKITLTLALLVPGLLGIWQFHPYQYAYYNALAGNPYRVYETDYWLTCYKDALEWTRANQPSARLHIQREFEIANYYAEGLSVFNLQIENESDLHPGDLLLFSTRANLDKKSTYRNLPVVHSIGRGGADYCLIKQKE